MDLTCERVREVLWPLDRPRRHVPDEEVAREHLTRCDDCRAFFLHDGELSRLLRRLGEGIEIPSTADLRLSVARALAVPYSPGMVEDSAPGAAEIRVVDRPPGFGGRRAGMAAAAAALLLLLGGQLLAGRYGGDRDTDRFTADFVRTAAVEFDQTGLDVWRIGGFYERELGRRILPVALYEAPVTRATVCDLRGQLGSMVEYDLAGTRLVHYRIPIDADEVTPRGQGVVVDSMNGVQVAHWTDTEFEHALVSRAPGEHLAWLAGNRFRQPPSVTNYGSPASRTWRPVALSD